MQPCTLRFNPHHHRRLVAFPARDHDWLSAFSCSFPLAFLKNFMARIGGGTRTLGRDFEGNQVPHPAHLPCLGCTNCHPHRWRFRASSSRVSEFLEPSCTTIRRLSPWRLLETRQAPAASVVPVLMPS